jgi:hypothetical protein
MTDWHALLGEYANELIGWAHTEGRAIVHKRKDYDMAIQRYCVMCLADGERKEATRVIDGAGYCRACLATRREAGLSTTEDAKPKAESKQYGKLTAKERTEILAADEDIPAAVLARKYGVCDKTIYNIRKAADARVAAAVEWMQEEQPTVSPVVHIPIPTAAHESFTRAPEKYAPPEGWFEPVPEPTPFDGPGPEVYTEPIQQPAEPESFRVLVAFDVTHEQADAIWNALPLEEKAAFVQGKLIERWNLL